MVSFCFSLFLFDLIVFMTYLWRWRWRRSRYSHQLPLMISRWRLTDSFIPIIERRKRDTVAFDSFTRWVANQEQIHRTSVLLLCVSSYYYYVVRWLIDWLIRFTKKLRFNCRVNKSSFSFGTHVWGGGSRRTLNIVHSRYAHN